MALAQQLNVGKGQRWRASERNGTRCWIPGRPTFDIFDIDLILLKNVFLALHDFYFCHYVPSRQFRLFLYDVCHLTVTTPSPTDEMTHELPINQIKVVDSDWLKGRAWFTYILFLESVMQSSKILSRENLSILCQSQLDQTSSCVLCGGSLISTLLTTFGSHLFFCLFLQLFFFCIYLFCFRLNWNCLSPLIVRRVSFLMKKNCLFFFFSNVNGPIGCV